MHIQIKTLQAKNKHYTNTHTHTIEMHGCLTQKR